MPLTIRRASAADTDVLVAFNQALAQESEGKSLDPNVLRAGVAAGLTDPAKALYFVAEDNGTVLGQLMVTTEWSDWRNGWMWWIQSVYVRPEARRAGVFRTLYEHVYQAACAEAGVIGLRLYVEHANDSAQQTYRRLGMDQTGYLVFERCPL
jgi:ribosomal protein S18 acetylase RimI-like enzyme